MTSITQHNPNCRLWVSDIRNVKYRRGPERFAWFSEITLICFKTDANLPMVGEKINRGEAFSTSLFGHNRD